ncbi:MAG TPA: type I DNA topoisomerase [Candidatus Paceibacterota bacterium]
MKLVIVESPSKAKTIGKYLGKDFEVKASVGHVRDLPKSSKKAVDIEHGFTPHYEIVPGKEKIIDEIKKAAKKATEVLLATDPDREGEAIAWHIAELINDESTKSKVKSLKSKIKRVTYHEITKEAIEEALTHPRAVDQNLRQAQEARRVLDRLFGYGLSGLIWKKVRYGLSAGRVQSPALRIIMEREREIKAFIPRKFWVVSADVETKEAEKFTVIADKEADSEKEADDIVETAKKSDWKVLSVDESETKRSPRAPFITSTLQQSASSRLGFSPSRTMQIAQKLYEAGYITYMRTDSTNLSDGAKAQIAAVVKSKYGENYYSPRVYAAKVKNAQEAHEAIRPSNIAKFSLGHSPEQKKLYELIWARTVSSQMADAALLRTKIVAKAGNDDNPEADATRRNGAGIPTFSATGSRLVFPGWLSADPESRGEDVELPKVSKDDGLKLLDIVSTGKETEPPARYTEAGLIKELEKRGIGRPSTYASIMRTLEVRGYVTKENRTLHPTDTGEVVSDFLENNFESYISDLFTAEMEDKLDDISVGKREYEKTLSDFYKPFIKEVKAKEKTAKVTNLGDADSQWKCPVCGGPMIIKLSKNGKFMSCAKFPDCTGARTIEGKELAGPKETGELCPDCKTGKLLEREGRFGKFIACSNYPKCKFIKNDENAKPPSSGVVCPSCKTGEIVERRGRFGIFWSCANYPKCKFAIKAKPTGKICEMCQSLMMLGTKTIPERCSNKVCPNHNPHKLNK